MSAAASAPTLSLSFEDLQTKAQARWDSDSVGELNENEVAYAVSNLRDLGNRFDQWLPIDRLELYAATLLATRLVITGDIPADDTNIHKLVGHVLNLHEDQTCYRESPEEDTLSDSKFQIMKLAQALVDHGATAYLGRSEEGKYSTLCNCVLYATGRTDNTNMLATAGPLLKAALDHGFNPNKAEAIEMAAAIRTSNYFLPNYPNEHAALAVLESNPTVATAVYNRVSAPIIVIENAFQTELAQLLERHRTTAAKALSNVGYEWDHAVEVASGRIKLPTAPAQLPGPEVNQ